VTTQDAYNYAASKFFADQQLSMVLKLDGLLDESVLAQAVRLALDAEPVLGCRLAETDGSLFWERRNDLDAAELCRVEETANLDVDIQAFINQPTDASVNPLVTIKILRGKDSDCLCIKVNHAVCDAGGLKEYVQILSGFYSRLVKFGECLFEPNLGRRDQSQIFERTKDCKSILMKEFPTPTWAFPQKEGNKRLHDFKVVSPEQFQAIKRFAQAKKVTINDILLTALYRTFFSINHTVEGKPMISQVSIDLRRYLPNHRAEAICNLSGALYVGLERKSGETFEGTLARVTDTMAKLKANYPGLESAAGLEYLFSQGFRGMQKYMAQSDEMSKKYNVTFPLLSNFGVLDSYNFAELRMVGGFISSPIMYQPAFMLGATTFKDEMTLSIGYCGQENNSQIKSFYEAFTEEMPK
jgi:NRPS condensation-like uncharacterized protein